MYSQSIKPNITINELSQLDIRVGTIEKVENVENSTRLLRLTVNFGSFERKILSSIRQDFDKPEELVGKQSIFIVNLEPKKMAGEYSKGMLLMIEESNGKLIFTTPDEPAENGSIVY